MERTGDARGCLRNSSRWLALLIAGALALAACGGGSGSEDKATELTVGIPSPLGHLDPAQADDGLHHFIRYLAYEPIIAADPATGEYGPALAEEFGYVGEGNTTYEFTLREGAVFSDGTPLDAQAVKVWLEYFSETSASYASVMPLASVTAVDDRTVRLELAVPTPTVEVYLSSSNWAFVSQLDPDRMSNEMLGAGPYVYQPSESIEGDTYTFYASENYYDSSVQHYEKVTVRVIDNANSMLSAVRSGEIDLALGDPSTAEAAEAASGIDVFHGPGSWAGFEFFDMSGATVEALGDVRVRQALNYAIDRETFASAFMGNYGEPTSALVVLDIDTVAEETRNFYDYDPERARQLLAEAGYADGFTLPVLVKGWLGNAGTPMVQAAAAAFQEIGIELEIETVSTSGDFFGQVLAGEVGFANWSTPAIPLYGMAVNRWVPGANLNMFGNDLTEVAELIERLAVVSPDEKAAALDEFTHYLTEQAYMIPIFTTPIFVYANADKVTGISNEHVNKYLAKSPFILLIEPR